MRSTLSSHSSSVLSMLFQCFVMAQGTHTNAHNELDFVFFFSLSFLIRIFLSKFYYSLSLLTLRDGMSACPLFPSSCMDSCLRLYAFCLARKTECENENYCTVNAHHYPYGSLARAHTQTLNRLEKSAFRLNEEGDNAIL